MVRPNTRVTGVVPVVVSKLFRDVDPVPSVWHFPVSNVVFMLTSVAFPRLMTVPWGFSPLRYPGKNGGADRHHIIRKEFLLPVGTPDNTRRARIPCLMAPVGRFCNRLRIRAVSHLVQCFGEGRGLCV